MFNKILIANRGAIACRIIRTLKKMGIKSVAVYSDADRHAAHVMQADEAVHLGAAPASESYLHQEKIIAAAHTSGAQAIHPGYGFLSENAAFAEACEGAGIVFIGPTPQQMRDFGLKHTARALAQQNHVPLLPGSGLLDGVEHARREALRIGYPVMLKSTAGGGGIGMQLCRDAQELHDAFASVERLARNNFSQGGIFLEKYVEIARHIEVQIFGDGAGNIATLGERDCSVQRRNQKVIEETPAPGLSDTERARLYDAARKLGRALNYRSAGTVEFVYDVRTREFYFLEVNTRLQVEHGVTEEVTGIDLVEWMVRVAAGQPPDLARYIHAPHGHAIQVRLYAEDPNKNFQPAGGLLTQVSFPNDLRVDSWVNTGSEVSAYYDPMLAKIVAHGDRRARALEKLATALAETQVHGIETNLAYLRQVLASKVFCDGTQYTRYLASFEFKPATVDVLQPGTQTTMQDWPGRIGYWNIGVPPSGPMDSYAFRLANRIAGNAEGAAALEFTVTGAALRFNTETVIALTGAHMQAELDGAALAYWQPIQVRAGSVLKLRGIQGGGNRTYLAVRGGFDVPEYMGSRATFTLGKFGGHGGRPLRVGDVLRISKSQTPSPCKGEGWRPPWMAEVRATQEQLPDGGVSNGRGKELTLSVPQALIPHYSNHWDIAVMYGPHGAPDFFTAQDIETFFATEWEVHYNSSRTGVRLIGPKPHWARSDGGEAGLHPSNIHDNAYAIGAIDFTGDMPVILGPDGPSLGGFVCPATIVQAELWKIGQLRPGDTLRFRCIGYDTARVHAQALDVAITNLTAPYTAASAPLTPGTTASPVLHRTAANGERPAVCYRQAGDAYFLVEYGPLVLDLELRFRVHALMQWITQNKVAGLVDLTPGIRSLQIHYNPNVLAQRQLVELLRAAEDALPSIDAMEVPSRIVHLPLSWDDPATQLAIDKYMQSVRADAPWCPSNIEFIRRINGLDSIGDVKRIVFGASYLVMGLGDVYLGAPVATPLDPRHRLVTTKYNPARTWTPENAVGIGGAYLCVYGMEGPGGYQFVGRTVQMWNRFHQTADFTGGKQWLLRFFDQIRFYEVDAEELLKLRDAFPHGRFELRTEDSVLRLSDYRKFMRDNAASIMQFKHAQQAAFDAERERWAQSGPSNDATELASDAASVDGSIAIPPGCIAVAAPVTGSVWKVNVKPGDQVNAGMELLVVEAMKMEISIEADAASEVVEVLCMQGTAAGAGQALVILRPAGEAHRR